MKRFFFEEEDDDNDDEAPDLVDRLEALRAVPPAEAVAAAFRRGQGAGPPLSHMLGADLVAGLALVEHGLASGGGIFAGCN